MNTSSKGIKIDTGIHLAVPILSSLLSASTQPPTPNVFHGVSAAEDWENWNSNSTIHMMPALNSENINVHQACLVKKVSLLSKLRIEKLNHIQITKIYFFIPKIVSHNKS